MTRPPRWARAAALLLLTVMLSAVAATLVAWALGTPAWEWGGL